jgi:hypothetical protein
VPKAAQGSHLRDPPQKPQGTSPGGLSRTRHVSFGQFSAPGPAFFPQVGQETSTPRVSA